MQRISIVLMTIVTVFSWSNGAIGLDRQLQPLTGLEVPDFAVNVVPGNYDPSRDDADILGERFQVGATYYDYQANGAMSKQIALDEDGNIHIVWMSALDENNPVAGDRNVYYNFVIDDEPQFDEGVTVNGELARAGYTNIGYSEQTGAVPIYHAGGEIRLYLSFDENIGNGEFTPFEMPNDNDGAWYVWPHGTIDRNGRSHTLARWYPLPGNAQPVDPIDLQYNQGSFNDDGEWEYSDPVIIGLSKVLGYTVAASKASDRVGLLYFAPAYEENEWGGWQGVSGVGAANNNLMLVESEDGVEFNFDEQTNITQVLRPNDGEDEDSPFYIGDTLRPYLYVDACYDADDNLHVVFSTPLLAEAIGNNQRRYDEQHNLLWHWDRESDQFSLIASGRYNVQGLIGTWRSNISYPSIGVGEDGTLYCIFTRYPEDDQGPANVNGQRWVNGEIYCSASVDGGATWSEAINITETPTPDEEAGDCQSEAWCTIAETVDDYLHISYILDLDPGGLAQSEGSATLNPVIYHRVSPEEIPTEPKMLGMDFHVGYPPEADVDVDLPQVVAVPDGEPGEMRFTVRNSNEEAGAIGLHLRLTPSESLADMVSFESNVMRVGPGMEEAFIVYFSPDEAGVFEDVIFMEHNDPNIESPLELTFNGLGADGYGSVTGTVIDASNNATIAGATITLPAGGYETVSDDDGNYQFEEIPAWNYTLVCNADGFLPTEDEFELEPDQNVELDITMFFGLFELDIDNVDLSIGADEQFTSGLTITNEGNGSVQFNTEVTAFPDDEGREQFSLIEHTVLTEQIGDRYLQGAVFVEDNFYIAGGNNGEDENLIYVVNRDGEQVSSFPQFGDSRLGMRDLAYDGTLIWGSDEETVYGFTTDGELMSEIEGPYNPNNGIAWDPDNGLLWIANRSLDIIAIDLDGNVIQEIERPEERPSIYALAYYPFDRDGYPLYLFARSDGLNRQLWKCNIETGEYIQVVNFAEPQAGRANGIEITGEYDSHNWVLVGLLEDGVNDAIATWQLAQRSDWVSIEPANGAVSPDEPLEVELIFNTQSFGEDDELTADILFNHNGRGDPVELPVTVLVTVDGGITQRSLELQFGWNMVSLNIIPETDDIRELARSLVDNGSLMLVKDDRGRFYAPAFDDFINIPNWNHSEGYMFRMSEDDNLEVVGEGLAADTPIDLSAGWQMIAYYPRDAVAAPVALSGIVDNLLIAKNGYGRFYVPEFGFNNMEPMQEGQGYQINTREAGELVYQMDDGDDGAAVVFTPSQSQHFMAPAPTDQNMSLLLIDVPGTFLEIAAFNQDNLVGCGTRGKDGMVGVAVWGNDQLNEEALLELVGWTGGEEIALEIEWVKGQSRYETDALTVGRVLNQAVIPNEFALYHPYPNPFNSRAIVRFDLPEASAVSLLLYDVNGRIVAELVKGQLEAGSHTAEISGTGIPSGIYFYQLQAGTFNQIHKTILLK